MFDLRELDELTVELLESDARMFAALERVFDEAIRIDDELCKLADALAAAVGLSSH